MRHDSALEREGANDQKPATGECVSGGAGEWSAAEGIPMLSRTGVPELFGSNCDDGPEGGDVEQDRQH
eukprot:572727-Pleurochrysis_carterae.AAC.1